MSGCIIVTIVLAVVVGIPYLLHEHTGIPQTDPSWPLAILQVVAGLVGIIAIGSLIFKFISPLVQKLSDRGFRHLEFRDDRVTDVENEFSIALDAEHIAELSGNDRIVQLRIAGADKEIPVTLQGYSRSELLAQFDDPDFVKKLETDSPNTTRTALRANHVSSTDVTGQQTDLHEGFNLDALHAGHTEIVESIAEALYRHRRRNLSYRIHSEFPWHVTPQPAIDGVHRLNLDVARDAQWKETVEHNAHVEIPGWAVVSSDHLLISQAGPGTILRDIATLGRREYDELVTYYLLPLGEVECRYATRTTAGTTDNPSTQETVHEIRGTDPDGNKIRLDIPVGHRGTNRLGEDNENRIYRKTLHRFINEIDGIRK